MKIKNFKLLNRLNNEQGSLLIFSYLIVVVFLGLGAALLSVTINEARVSERERITRVAFNIAEAGIERGLYDLREDFSADEDWGDGDINGHPIGPDTVLYYSIPYLNTNFDDGAYEASLRNDAGNENIFLKSTGTYKDTTHSLKVYVRMVNVSPWNNAIFGGAGGASGTMINGNVDVRGSVHILGDGLADGDFAMDLGGTSEIVGNNYNGMDPVLEALVPALPTVWLNSSGDVVPSGTPGAEEVETLSAELRVKNGKVGLSGSSQVGEINATGNSEKERVDGVFITDPWGGTQGAASAYSDNGTTNAYDLGDAVVFPSLSDPHPDNLLLSFQEYYKTNALVLDDELENIQPTSSFSYTDGTNSIVMSAGHITIRGQIYLTDTNGNGDSLGLFKNGGNTTITYETLASDGSPGGGAILAEGDVALTTHLTTASFPATNILGIMTPGDMSIGTNANTDIMGIFYAENQIVVDKQTDIVGTIVTNYFDLGTNVPSIYQVPDVLQYVPGGMIGSNAKTFMVVVWQKI